MRLYTGLIKCGECNHSFKARKERNNINYRCNYRLKYGKNKCTNEAISFITYMVKQQLDVINMNIDNVDVSSIIDIIIVTNTRFEIFFKIYQ